MLELILFATRTDKFSGRVGHMDAAGSPHAIQHHLGRKLQGMYAQIPATPLPDRLNQLLAQLDTAGGTV